MKGKTIAVGLMAALCLGVIGAVAIAGIQGAYSANLTSERSKLSATAQVTAAFLAQKMDGIGKLEQLAVKRAEFVAALGQGVPSPSGLLALQGDLQQLGSLEPDFNFASLSDSLGTLRAIWPANPSLVGQNFAYRDWYAGVMSTGTTYVSNVYVSAVSGAPLIVGIGTPVFAARQGAQPEKMIGILLIGYKIGSLRTFAAQLSSLQQIGLQLADQQGTLMTTAEPTSGGSIVTTEGPALLAALNGRSITAVSSGVIAAGAPVPKLGWAVSVSTEVSATPAGAGGEGVTIVAIGLLVALGLGGCAIVVVTGRLERAEGRHKAAENKLRTVQESLTDGIIVYDADGRLASMNRAAQHLFELEERDDQTAESVASRFELIREDGTLVPVERSPVILVQNSDVTAGGSTMGIRSRASQTVRWLSFSTSPIIDRHSRTTGYVTSVRDVTERLETIRELRIVSSASAQMSSTLLVDPVIAALTHAASELCSATGEPQRRAQLFLVDGPAMTNAGEHDPDGTAYMKGASFQISDHPYARQVIASREAAVAHLDYSVFGKPVAAAMQEAAITNCVWVPMIRDGNVFAILAVAGRQNGLIGPATLEHLKALTAMGVLALANAALHDTVANLARTDPLTGTANRRALSERISQLPRVPFAFVAVDVDGLKPVNDLHGHAAGDELLSSLATCMQSELRSADVLARTGGDEFVILMVGSDARGASEMAARLKMAVSRLHLSWGTPSISVGSAAGAAGDDPSSVADKADTALYASKQLRQQLAANVHDMVGAAVATQPRD